MLVIVSEITAVAVCVPDVPVRVIGYVPSTVEELTAKVTALVVVVGLAPKVAVTPVGTPDAARVTLPVPDSVTVMVSVPLAPCAIDRDDGEAESVKHEGAAGTVSAIEVTAVRDPDVPVTVIVPVLAVQLDELAAVSVSTLEVADEVGLNDAVTPVGIPEAVKATIPLKGLTSVTVMVSVALAP